MHCLSGTYLKEIPDDHKQESFDAASGQTFFPVKIAIPPNKSRVIYFFE
jgi:hypothetical protein